MPEKYPEESIQRSEHGESLKSRILTFFVCSVIVGCVTLHVCAVVTNVLKEHTSLIFRIQKSKDC